MTAAPMIPHILQQTYFRRDLHPAIAANVDRLRAANPGWDYRSYDDADIEAFIRREYPPRFLAQWPKGIRSGCWHFPVNTRKAACD